MMMATKGTPKVSSIPPGTNDVPGGILSKAGGRELREDMVKAMSAVRELERS